MRPARLTVGLFWLAGAFVSLPLPSETAAAQTATVVTEAINAQPPSATAIAIRARLTDRRDRSLSISAEETKAVVAFFDARAGAPLFADANGLTPRALAVIAELSRANDWGLPASELTPAKLPNSGTPLSEAEIADVEVQLSAVVLKYARFARGGRIPTPAKQLATYIDRTPQILDPKVVLETIASAEKSDVALAGFNPQHAPFLIPRKAYVEAMAAKAAGQEARDFPSGPSLKPGMRHPQVALVRRWLKVEPPATEGTPADPTVFDPALKAAVIAFQTANGLEPADGIVGGRTRSAFNSLNPPSARRLLANMEQWRWMPDDLGATHIAVNIPEFTLRMIANAQVVHTERVVTGLVTNQTPLFSDDLQTVVLQPDWILPDSIKINEALPSLLDGSGMFYDNGLRIKRGNTPVAPTSVNWSSANLKSYTFYQPPGDANALGKVKFLFPNKHTVYMHDTPSKHLFAQSVRAYSHGCVRVRNPVRLAELVLGKDKGWSGEQVRDMLKNGPEDNKIALDRKVPVHFTYFTAMPDETGKIRSFPDVYGHEKRISLALEGRWGEIEIPEDHLAPIEDREFVTRSASSYQRRQATRDDRRQPYYGGYGSGGYSSGGDSFGNALKNLFGGF